MKGPDVVDLTGFLGQTCSNFTGRHGDVRLGGEGGSPGCVGVEPGGVETSFSWVTHGHFSDLLDSGWQESTRVVSLPVDKSQQRNWSSGPTGLAADWPSDELWSTWTLVPSPGCRRHHSGHMTPEPLSSSSSVSLQCLSGPGWIFPHIKAQKKERRSREEGAATFMGGP